MANTPQAKKRIRRNDRRADVNKSRVSRIRTFVKKVESAITAGNKDEAAEALKAAQPEMMSGASEGVLHKNTVARKISRLTKAVDRKSVVEGKRVSDRVDLGGRQIFKKKKKKTS